MPRTSDDEPLSAILTIGIKHTSAFARRRLLLIVLLKSIRQHYGHSIRVLIADDGEGDQQASEHRTALRKQGYELLLLGAGAGLSHGRNELVRAARTPFLALLDDDLAFHANTSLAELVRALRDNPESVVAGGCYVHARSGEDNCYNMRFDVEPGGAAVHLRPIAPVSSMLPDCFRVGITHNFFVARTAALRRFQWDARQKMMEHETFFYQLHLHQQRVLACPHVTVQHHTKALVTDKNYSRLSLRFKEQRFAQFLCKDYPELARLTTPFAQWHCRMRVFCTPTWWAQFAFDGSTCKTMHFSSGDDASSIELPLVSPAIHPRRLYARVSGAAAGSSMATASQAPTRIHRVPLLIIVTTRRGQVNRRQLQRATWLTYAWHQDHLSREGVPWRYVFAAPRSAAQRAKNGTHAMDEYMVTDRLMGDMVTLSAVDEDSATDAHVAAEALRWAHSRIVFDVVLVTNDEALIHIGRLWLWLCQTAASASNVTKIPLLRNRFPTAALSHLAAGAATTATGASHAMVAAGPDALLGCSASADAIHHYDARRPLDSSSSSLVGHGAPVSASIPHLTASSADMLTRSSGSNGAVFDPMIVRGYGADDALLVFRRLLMSSSCYGNLGTPVACPKTKSNEGLELSDRPWRESPLDDIRALALTTLTNKQLMRLIRGASLSNA